MAKEILIYNDSNGQFENKSANEATWPYTGVFQCGWAPGAQDVAPEWIRDQYAITFGRGPYGNKWSERPYGDFGQWMDRSDPYFYAIKAQASGVFAFTIGWQQGRNDREEIRWRVGEFDQPGTVTGGYFKSEDTAHYSFEFVLELPVTASPKVIVVTSDYQPPGISKLDYRAQNLIVRKIRE